MTSNHSQLFAEMHSGGPWYSAKVRATSILLLRAVHEGRLSWGEADYLLSQLPSEAFPTARKNGELRRPTPQMTRIWAKNDASFPEDAIRAGILSVGDLPTWARSLLRGDFGTATMGNSATRPVPLTEPIADGALGLGGLAALLVGIALIRSLFGPPQPQQVGRIGRSRPRIGRLGINSD